MRITRRYVVILAILIIMSTLACSININLTPTAVAPDAGVTLPPEPVKPLTPTNTMEKTTIPVNIEGLPCAIPSENEQLFTWYDSQKSFGVCFLYPLDFIKRNTEIPGNIFLTGVSYGGRELSSASMEIDIEPANGLTTEEFAQNAAAKAGPGLESTLYQIILPDDVTAMKTESLPGQAASRTIYVVNNDVAFTLTFMPLDQTNQDAWVDMERIYSLFSLTWEFTR